VVGYSTHAASKNPARLQPPAVVVGAGVVKDAGAGVVKDAAAGVVQNVVGAEVGEGVGAGAAVSPELSTGLSSTTGSPRAPSSALSVARLSVATSAPSARNV
jgi:hypothetical protein